MSTARLVKALVFDWGGTLMVDFPQYSGPMVDWPEVSAVDGARSALETLHGRYAIFIATNAAESDISQIRAALDRVGLGRYVSAIFSQRNLGVSKREPESFFRRLEESAGLNRDEAVMIGDDYRYDVLGAHQAGWATVWYNPNHRVAPGLAPLQTEDIGSLADLPAVLERLSLPTYETCLIWQQEQNFSRSLLNHVEMVAAAAYWMALKLRARGEVVDPVLAHRGGLLHDLAKMASRGREEGSDHGQLAAQMLSERGQPLLAEIANRHVLSNLLKPDRLPRTWEEKLVYCADKLVEGSRLAGLDERMAALKKRYAMDTGFVEAITPKLYTLHDEVCAAMGIPVEELIPRLTDAMYGKDSPA